MDSIFRKILNQRYNKIDYHLNKITLSNVLSFKYGIVFLYFI